jgi:hypothetical protein
MLFHNSFDAFSCILAFFLDDIVAVSWMIDHNRVTTVIEIESVEVEIILNNRLCKRSQSKLLIIRS